MLQDDSMMDGDSPSVVLRNSVGWAGRHFDSLRACSQFCDVNLLSEDGASFPAHKVILSSQSHKLRTILAQFPASPFCLYLAGVAGRDLASLLAFIYSGEVRLSQTELPSFLSAANTLQITVLLEHQREVRGERYTVEDQMNVSEEDVIEIKEETDVSHSEKSQSPVETMRHEHYLPPERKYTKTDDLKSEETSDDVEEEEEEEMWDDVKTVPFEFVKTGNSKLDGMLVTHGRNYKFSKNNTSKSGKVHYYTCSEKKSGCKASAVIQRLERFDEREGRLVIENRLVSVSRPEVHAKVHQADNSAIEVLRLISLMKQEVARDPSVPTSKKYISMTNKDKFMERLLDLRNR